MSDVARRAGVSKMTVSNVLNGRTRVGEATRRRVLEAVDELGYEINLTARRLRAGRVDTVALIVPRFDHTYFAELATSFATEVANHGRHLVVAQSGASKEGELSELSLARLRQYDAVVLSAVGLTYDEVDSLSSTQPLVLLGEQDVPQRFDHVSIGNAEGARLAVRHLLGRGARRVAVVDGPSVGPAGTGAPGGLDPTSGLRTQGWRTAHADVGLVPDERLVLGGALYTAQGAREVVLRALAAGLAPDAVFAVTDDMAYGVLAALHDAGLRVPQDVAVVGFDNLRGSEFAVPGLSSVDPGRDWIARQAVSVIERRLAGEAFEPVRLTTPVELVVRGSSA
ncbi:LacI family DNA-binding transcriptional regulator [Cellulomonas shaoxiangyii]|uniref:LacI family transcriptional regulator n=1 Tax=Cellulomonas shaoxiangyii TaxID=2566013 RepID=A0A4P7SR09_9CELL|nr:LacI family DNA-binding transcriptional regulator [Cellulomonas shaoxiangyii]QCB95163.1 LacI family transcriptional regulator [Cellulomonas shaoxiangyii]TGY78401.1 LacI family transcriptional regulator [Cellulomonas shaoxiangyii]